MGPISKIAIHIVRREIGPLIRQNLDPIHCYREFSSEVVRIHRTMNRDLTEERMKMRFGHGLHFYALEDRGTIIATTWLIMGKERFIDEIGVGFALGASDVWIRDIFVSEAARGKGAFGRLLDSALTFAQRQGYIWSDYQAANKASARAHERYGFVKLAEVHAVKCAGFLWRQTQAAGLEWISAYKPHDKFIWVHGAFADHVRLHKA